MDWKRHTLLDISDAGRQGLLDDLVHAGRHPASRKELAQVLLPQRAGARIPGIVRRGEGVAHAAGVPVGFCGPVAGPEGRLRIAAQVHPGQIVRRTCPFQLLSMPVFGRTASLQALLAVRLLAGGLGLSVGVWGSAALEIYTGLPYTHPDSDLDLLVAPAAVGLLRRFQEEIQAMEKSFALRMDVELDLPNGYGVQLKEVLGQGRTVLGKSFADVALLPREQVLSLLPRVQDPAPSTLGRRQSAPGH
jgi:phosphoribosyl-dephospho-CoA transferase